MAALVAMRAATLMTVVLTLQSASSAHALLASSVKETIAAFDRNNNGKVDRSEIEVVARSQGIGVEEVLGDFQDIDTNGDGELDMAELARVLGAAVEQPALNAAPAPIAQHPQDNLAATLAEKIDAVVPPSGSQPTSGLFATPPAATLGDETPVFSAHAPSTKLSEEVESEQSSMLLDAKNVEEDAQQQAGAVLAMNFANKAKQLLMQSNSDEKSAAYFQTLARSLRGNVQNILKHSDLEMKNVARQTTGKMVQETLPKVQKLQLEESEVTQKADEHRTLARQAMERVVKAQKAMTKFLQ